MSEEQRNKELASAPDAPDEAKEVKKSGSKFKITKLEFTRWLAVPEFLRFPATAREFAAQHGVAESTLSVWKGKSELVNEVKRLVIRDASLELADMCHALKRAARDGNVAAIRLYLEFVLGWVDGPTSAIVENNIEVRFGDEGAIPWWRAAKEESKEN
jgi:putative insertion element HTH domain-containing protein